MRCKNCGAENDDSRYICEICGSPLYDENDEIKIQDEDEQENETSADDDNNNEEDKKKRNIIIGIVGAVVAVIIIVIIIFAAGGGDGDEGESSSLAPSSEASTIASTAKKPVTTEQQTKPSTIPSTTPSTAPPTAPPTIATFRVAVDIDGNGTVTGDGAYESGKKAVLSAVPDDGYQFAGWFDNNTGKLVASGSKYTVNVSGNLRLTAKFEKIEATTAQQEEAVQ